MQLPDVNVLIYAHGEDAPEHDRYAAWLRALTDSDEPFALSDTVLAGFLRIVTNPRIFDPPTPMETALAFCQRLVDWPRASLITPSRRHWDLFVNLCRGIKGPLVAGAYIAALAIEHGCELMTTDSDFARFPGLRWLIPWRHRNSVEEIIAPGQRRSPSRQRTRELMRLECDGDTVSSCLSPPTIRSVLTGAFASRGCCSSPPRLSPQNGDHCHWRSSPSMIGWPPPRPKRASP